MIGDTVAVHDQQHITHTQPALLHRVAFRDGRDRLCVIDVHPDFTIGRVGYDLENMSDVPVVVVRRTGRSCSGLGRGGGGGGGGGSLC